MVRSWAEGGGGQGKGTVTGALSKWLYAVVVTLPRIGETN